MHHIHKFLPSQYVSSYARSIGNKGKYIYAIFLTTNLAATAAATTTTILNYPPKEQLKK